MPEGCSFAVTDQRIAWQGDTLRCGDTRGKSNVSMAQTQVTLDRLLS